jgi:hypothetical protein
LGCNVNHKTKASNGIRDENTKVFQPILPIVKMFDSPTQMETELHNIVPSLPRLKPFDLSIRLDHSLDTRCWRTPYTRIGFDVTLIHSTNDSTSSASGAAQYNKTDSRLRDGEKMKFARRPGGTNPITNKTLSADEVIGEILDTNNVFIPIAVWKPLPEIYQTDQDTPSTILQSRPTNDQTPHGQPLLPSRTAHLIMFSAQQMLYGRNHTEPNFLMVATCHSHPVHGQINGLD